MKIKNNIILLLNINRLDNEHNNPSVGLDKKKKFNLFYIVW